MKGRYTVIPMLAIRPGMVLTYETLYPHPYRSSPGETTGKPSKPLESQYTGLLTPGAKKRLIRAINLLIAISRPKKAVHFDSKKEFTFRVNFITLTLPCAQGTVTDKDLKSKCLKVWLEWCKDHYVGFSYVWRAERQGNGNLHFHLITNTYVHYKDLRDSWNRALNCLSFIDDFERTHGHRHPNSTDVHAVKAIRNLAAYIAKYMSKKEKEGQTVEGRLWDCSKNLKAKIRCAWPMATADFDNFQRIYNELPDNAFSNDHCAGIQMTEKEMRTHFPVEWVREYSDYLQSVREAN